MPRILQVEGDTHTSKLVTETLKQANYDVLSVDSIEEALEEISNYDPDLVITCAFNDSVGTSEFVKEIKKLTHNTRVILHTGSDTKDVAFIQPLLNAGVDGVLQKPCNMKALLKEVETQLLFSAKVTN
jgi:DNA-binding response OmpR family regulator